MVKPWDTATIGDFLDFKNGLNKGKEFFGYGTTIVNYTDVYKKRGLKKADIRGRVCLTLDEIHRFDVRKNDVFFTRTSETPDEVGMSSVLLEDVENGVFSGFVLRGRPKNDMFVPEYCKYCFSTEAVRNAIIAGCTYTTRALTNGKQLSAIEIPVPPKPEQEAIAAALSDIDALIVSLEKLIAKKKAIKQGAMQELLTGKRRLPGFGGDWAECVLTDVADLMTDTIPVSDIDSRYYIGTDNMVSNRGGIKQNRIELQYTVVRRYIVNDILLSNIRPYLKKIWFADTNGGCSSDVLVIRAKSDGKILAGFLYQLLSQNAFFDEVTANAVGTKMPRGDKNIIKTYPLYIPVDLGEQREILRILAEMQIEVENLEENLNKYRQIKQGMMSELLTGRIRLL